jgi:predicted esterase
MRVWATAALIAMLVQARASAEDAGPEAFLRRARFDPAQEYYLYVPGADACPEECPLFIFAHGTYSTGSGDFVMWKNYADKEGFILIAPHFEGSFNLLEKGEDRQLLRIVDEVDQEHPVDHSRVLLCGFSRGGMFAYRIAMQHPSFAHTVILFGAGDFAPPVRASGSRPARFYLASGSEDPFFPGQQESHFRALREAGYKVNAYEAKGVGHSIPTLSVTHVLGLFRAMKTGQPYELGGISSAAQPSASSQAMISGPSVTLHFKGGGAMTGRLVEERPDAVVIGWSSGSAEFSRERIDRIEKSQPIE